MKYTITILFMIFSLLGLESFGQKYTLSQKNIIHVRVDSLLKDYLTMSNLIEPGGIKQSNEIMSKFKLLFTKDAKIYDDILPTYDSLEFNTNPYKVTKKPLQEYFRGLVYEFPKGLIVLNKKINISYKDQDNGIIKVALERIINATSHSKKYKIFNHDSLLLTLSIAPNLTVKISDISSLNIINNIKVINDADLDGIIDTQDDCKDIRGKQYLKGCPDQDNDGIPDKDDDCPGEFGSPTNKGCPPSTFTYSIVLSGSLAYHLNKHVLSVPTSGFSYEKMDKVKSTFGKVKNPGVKPSVALDLNLAYYFGKRKFKKNFGVSANLFINNYRDDYQVSGIKYFYKSNDGVDDYRRIVTIKEANENITFSILNFALQLKYRGKLKNTRFATEIGFGPGYITSLNKYQYQATVDYEGIYRYNMATKQFEYSQNYNEQNTDWILVGETINSKDNSIADNAFSMYQQNSSGYDFGLNKVFNEKDSRKLSKRKGYSLNANLDLLYHLSSKIAAKAGVAVIYANLSNKTNSYKISDRISDKYTSIYESNAKSNYFTWGISLGLAIGI